MQSVAYTFLYIRCEALYYLNGENAWGSKLFDTPSYTVLIWGNSPAQNSQKKIRVGHLKLFRYNIYVQINSRAYIYDLYIFLQIVTPFLVYHIDTDTGAYILPQSVILLWNISHETKIKIYSEIKIS